MLKLKALYTVCFHSILLHVFDDTIRMWPGKIFAGLVIRYVLSEFSSVVESIFYVNLKFLDVQGQEVVCSFLMSVIFITTK
jgi:hypothetical protein